MAKPLTDDEIEAIVADIRAEMPRNEIARKHGRAAGTISKIAADNDLSFDRSATKTACAAKKVDVAMERATLQQELLGDARKLRRQLWEPCVEKKPMVVSDGVQEGSHVEIVEVHFDRPPFADQQRIMTSVGIAVDKVIAIEKLDQSDDHDGARGLLERLVAGLEDVAA